MSTTGIPHRKYSRAPEVPREDIPTKASPELTRQALQITLNELHQLKHSGGSHYEIARCEVRILELKRLLKMI